MLPPYKFPLHCVNFIDLDKWRTHTKHWMPFICHIAIWKSLPFRLFGMFWPINAVPSLPHYFRSLMMLVQFRNSVCQMRSEKAKETESKRAREQAKGKKRWRKNLRTIEWWRIVFCALWWHKYPFDLIFNHIMYIVYEIVCHFSWVFIMDRKTYIASYIRRLYCVYFHWMSMH